MRSVHEQQTRFPSPIFPFAAVRPPSEPRDRYGSRLRLVSECAILISYRGYWFRADRGEIDRLVDGVVNFSNQYANAP